MAQTACWHSPGRCTRTAAESMSPFTLWRRWATASSVRPMRRIFFSFGTVLPSLFVNPLRSDVSFPSLPALKRMKSENHKKKGPYDQSGTFPSVARGW